MRVGIVNNALGNVESVRSAFAFYNYDVFLAETPDMLDAADVAVLAGVGTFRAGVTVLREKGFWERLDHWVCSEGRPLLGICLGMQLFARRGHEGGRFEGFGWISGDVLPLEGQRIPHMGWTEVFPCAPDGDALLQGVRYGHFYFMHGFHFVPEDSSVVVAKAFFEGKSFVAAVKKGSLVGVQFHPEKSQGDGLRVLRNLMEAWR
jgi:glutamine amidotransferase